MLGVARSCHDHEVANPQIPPRPASATIRVVVVDDQELFRRGLTMLLGVEDDIEVVGEASDGQTAVETWLHAVVYACLACGQEHRITSSTWTPSATRTPPVRDSGRRSWPAVTSSCGRSTWCSSAWPGAVPSGRWC